MKIVLTRNRPRGQWSDYTTQESKFADLLAAVQDIERKAVHTEYDGGRGKGYIHAGPKEANLTGNKV